MDTSANLKNICLKPQRYQSVGITLELLNGLVDEINIEGNILERKIKIDLSSFSISVLIPDLSNILYQYSKPKQVIIDPCVEFAFQKNGVNRIYSLISRLSLVNLKISNLNLNIFLVIEDELVHFAIKCDEISLCSDIVDNNANMTFEMTNMRMNSNIVNMGGKLNVYQTISNGNFANKSCPVIQKTNLTVKVSANEYYLNLHPDDFI